MTTSQRQARICLTLAALGLLSAPTTIALSGNPWLCIPGLYTAAFFAWCTARLYTDHRRTLAEQEWARRRALGEMPPPLNPCCRLSQHTDGTAHDHRCTDQFHGIAARLHVEPEEHTS